MTLSNSKTYHSEADSALFPHVDHPAQLDDSSLHRVHEQNRPRPARLPSLQDQELEAEEEESIRRGDHNHAGHVEDHDLLDEGLGEEDEYAVEEEDADDDEHGSEGLHSHGGEEEENDDEGDLVDDTISIHGSPQHDSASSSSLDDDMEEEGEEEEEEDGESLTALEELLLDADTSEEAEALTPEEEEAQHRALQYRRPIGDAGKGGDILEKLRREREELGRVREKWEAKMRAGEKDDDEIDEDDESWVGSGELRQRRMLKRIRR